MAGLVYASSPGSLGDERQILLGGGRVMILRSHCCVAPPLPTGVLSSLDGGLIFGAEQCLHERRDVPGRRR
jgi:hypothetical protein